MAINQAETGDQAQPGDQWEHVYSMRDWYDGPRSGAADYRGAPHWFCTIAWDTGNWDADKDCFHLTPLSPETLNAILEMDRLWRRWQAAKHFGTAPQLEDGEPRALPEDREHYLLLEARMEDDIAAFQGERPLARGEFSGPSDQVCWLDV